MHKSFLLVSLLATIFAISSSCENYEDDYQFDFTDENVDERASSVVDTYQAEDRSFQNGCKEMSNNAGFTGRGFMDYGGNRTLIEWNDIDAPSAGQYTLVFRYANGSGGNRQCRINVNDRTNAGNVAFAKTGSWTTWRTKSIKVTLKQGNNKIRVTANTGAGGPNLDKMDLISEGDPVVETDRCALVNENSTASLSCPGGQVVKSIDFASYGLPTGSCTAGFSIGTCHASTSKSKVQSLCLNQQSCRIGAKNAVFGDPCAGKRKKLAVLYTCSGATTGVAAKDFVGHYERTPVLNNWHKVDITLENNALWWKNAAGRRWSLSYANGELKTGSDCPYGVKTIEVEKQSGSDPVKSLKFNGGQYHKNGGDEDDFCPDDPHKTEPGNCGCGVPEGSCDDDNSNVSIDAIFFAQTHVQQPSDPYFNLVANRKALIKAHIIAPGNPAAPAVRAILSLDGKIFTVPLSGPATLPASIPKAPGVVKHSYSNSFTGFIPPNWMKQGLSVTVAAGGKRVTSDKLSIGAPTKVVMTMFDVQYFQDTNSDYPSGWKEEFEAKRPVSSLEVRRVPHVVFEELVIPARSGVPAVRVTSKDDYKVQTGLNFDGEQGAALHWNGALKAAAGTAGRHTLYYINIYGVHAGGQAGNFGGVGSGTNVGILNHETGHSLGLGDCYGGGANFPYKGDMYGISAPEEGYQIHVGPVWAFDLNKKAFIPPTVQPNSVGGPVGTFKRDPMCGGGKGDQEQGYVMRHFSDYSVQKMLRWLEGHVVIWNRALGSYASWDSWTNGYTKKVTNNGVQYPVARDVSVISILASISGVSQDVNMVYPPIGPYTAGIIKLFDPRNGTQRQEADSIYCPAKGCDVTLKITQGGVQKYYMLAASWDTTADPLINRSLQTRAVNLRASDGAVTRTDLLLTPDAERNGLPTNPRVLFSWRK